MLKRKTLEDIVLQHSPLAWWEWDVVSNTVTMNDLKVTMLGYHPDEFTGKGYETFTELLHPDDYEKTMDAMRDVFAGKKKIYQIDYRIKDSTQRYHWYMDRGAAIAYDQGSITRMRGIVIDLGVEKSIGANIDAVVALLSKFAENKNNLIIICSSCKKVKINTDEWTPITDELLTVIADTISHGICPQCVQELYPEYVQRIKQRNENQISDG